MGENKKGGFDDLMASLGVRPMKGQGATEKARPASVKRRESPPLAPAPPPDPSRDALRRAERALADARSEIGQREAELASLQQQLDGATAELAGFRERLRDVERQQIPLVQALRRAQAEVPGGLAAPDLMAVLRRRGLLGPDEATAALVALAGARQIERILPMLVAVGVEELDALLDDRLALVCEAELCQPPSGRAILRVRPERCDVCGGSDLRRLVSRLENACLLHGRKRLTILGGSPRYHRLLRQLFADSRIEVTLVAGDLRSIARKAQVDTASSDVLLLWGASSPDPEVDEGLGNGPATVVRVGQRGLGDMLDRASAALER